MNNNNQPAIAQPPSVTPNETRKITVFLNGTQFIRASALICLEVPVDATEEEIKALEQSTWRQIAPTDRWSVDSPLDGLWNDDVDIDVSDASDVTRTDARVARTLDGQLVVLAN